MRICPAAATLVATAVRPAIGAYAVVTAERSPSLNRAFSVRRALFAETTVAAALRTTEGTADTLDAIETATAMGTGRAATEFIAAAIECAVAGDAIVVTRDRAPVLAAFVGRRALTTQTDRPAGASPAAADTVDTAEATATVRILGAGPALVTAAIERAVRVNAVRGADRCAAGLTALPRLVAPGTNGQSA